MRSILYFLEYEWRSPRDSFVHAWRGKYVSLRCWTSCGINVIFCGIRKNENMNVSVTYWATCGINVRHMPAPTLSIVVAPVKKALSKNICQKSTVQKLRRKSSVKKLGQKSTVQKLGRKSTLQKLCQKSTVQKLGQKSTVQKHLSKKLRQKNR